MTRALLLALALCVGPAAAQQAPAEPPKKPENPPERRPLNLRLDNPSSFATVSPDKPPAKDLPTLGEDARRVAPPPSPAGTRSEGGPYPKDTNPNR